MSSIAFLYKHPLGSAEFNRRFGDILGSSVLNGFRLQGGTQPFKVSLVSGSDHTNLLVTKTGVRIETEDLLNVIEIEPNLSTSVARIDRVYAKYEHGDRNAVVHYVVSKGKANGEPELLENEETHTFLGEVEVPVNGAILTAASFSATERGLKLRDVGHAAKFKELVSFEGPVILSGAPTENNEAATKKYVDDSLSSQKEAIDENVATQTNSVMSNDVYASDYTEDGKVFRVLEYKREDGTLYLRSTLSELNAEGRHLKATIQMYNFDGVTVKSTQQWQLGYDAQGNLSSKNLL